MEIEIVSYELQELELELESIVREELVVGMVDEEDVAVGGYRAGRPGDRRRVG